MFFLEGLRESQRNPANASRSPSVTEAGTALSPASTLDGNPCRPWFSCPDSRAVRRAGTCCNRRRMAGKRRPDRPPQPSGLASRPSVARGHYHMDRVRDLADACLAVADLDPGIRDRGIAIVGFSLGGALALRLASAPYLPAMVKTVVAGIRAARSRGGGGPDRPPPEPPLRAVVARASAARDGAGLARFTGLGARSPCARTPCPGLRRRRSPQWTRGFATRRTTMPHARRSAASTRSASPLSSCTPPTIPGFQSAVHHRTSSAPRHRHARRRPCRISRDRKPIALVRVCRRRVRSGVHERAMNPAYAVTLGRPRISVKVSSCADASPGITPGPRFMRA